ncbi:probable 3-hydroxyisobutyrate dehydrogenase-like 3, mitochondrial [Phoenix dactylifera]|uniref:Probable 3-hydroxyisobutyrate dehydrogenase-like 3, mitochondrial n=1 Tax=Phoenix dactylifera TaxID=42345 RepID=A0A8B7CFM9_PHODC|nr:probable 3-hydroxyisobutyrate dehydrogenase-like 3, mitochondrial [Phoenix dactylifera]
MESGGYPTPIRPGLTRVGWIGTGVMGAAMAGRIQSAGYVLTVYARTPFKAARLDRFGAQIVSSPADAARSSAVVFTMVSHPSDVRSAVLDPDSGVLSTLPAGGVLVDTTSSDPSLGREIAAAARSKGCWAIDAPVSGGDVGARDGKLAIFAGGAEKVIEWLSPLFEIMGKATRMGEAGSGQSSKIANQITVAGSLLGLSEALVFAEEAGLGKRIFLESLRGGAAASSVMEIFGERMLDRDFRPGAFVEYMVKDLGMGLGRGEVEEEGERVVLPAAALCEQLYLGMVASGDREMGIQGLLTAIERINGKKG